MEVKTVFDISQTLTLTFSDPIKYQIHTLYYIFFSFWLYSLYRYLCRIQSSLQTKILRLMLKKRQ